MKKDYKKWPKEDKELLKKLYEIDGLTASEITPILNRTRDAIQIKIYRWGFRHTKEQERKAKSRRVSGNKNPMFGAEAWNRGLTKETNEIIKKSGQKVSKTRKQMFIDGLLPDLSGENNPMYGLEAWNKGLTSETDDRVKSIGGKMSVFRKEEWKSFSEKERERRRKHCAFIGAQKKCLTSIEIKVHNLLDEMKIKFIIGYPIGYYVCDIYIPEFNLIIECHGDYWHSNPKFYGEDKKPLNDTQLKNLRRDKAKKTYLFNRKFNFLEFWENDIHRNTDFVIITIKKTIEDILTNEEKDVKIAA